MEIGGGSQHVLPGCDESGRRAAAVHRLLSNLERQPVWRRLYGTAVAFHGYPRATADLDAWIAVDPVNAARLVEALKDFEFDLAELSPDLFLREDRVIRMGVSPNRIEIDKMRPYSTVFGCGWHTGWRETTKGF